MLELKAKEERQGQLWKGMRDITDIARAEKRELHAEEYTQWSRMNDELDTVGKDIDMLRKQEEINKKLAGQKADEGRKADDVELGQRAFSRYLAGGVNALDSEEREYMQRAHSTTVASEGGYLVPTTLQNQIISRMAYWGGIREAVTILNTASGNPIPWPTADNTAQKGRRIAENTQATNDRNFVFGSKALGSHTYTSDPIRIPNELLQDSAFNLEAFIGEEVGKLMGRILNEECTTGTGSGMPQGLVTGSTLGVTGAAAAITFDNLIDLEHSLNRAYRQGGAFMFNDATLKTLRKLKDNEGNYIWQPGTTGVAPASILGYSYFINEDMANVATAQKSILFGDFSKYILRDVQGVTVRRLVERYADFNQIGIIAYSRHDGGLMDTAAVKHLAHA
jgi:HK97 family phage major capsid protein